MKKIFFALLIWPLFSLAQSYPSPTYNNLTVNGAFTATGTFTATGKVGLPNLATQAANTVVANATGSTATPTAVSITNCAGSSSALNYTGGSGFSCNGNINAITLGGATFASPGPIGSVSTSSGAFSSLTSPSVSFGGGTINATSVGATSASTGAFTTLSASGAVSGTGFSSYLASPPAIGGTTANTGKFTTLVTTSTYTPDSKAGLVGTTTNDNANAGSWGEFPTPTNLSNVSATTNTPVNVASISLTAGDWDVSGVGQFNPAGTTNSTLMLCGTSNTSGVRGAFGSEQVSQVSFPTGNAQVISTPTTRFSLSAPTTIYVVCVAGFTVSTMTISGFIRARRIR